MWKDHEDFAGKASLEPSHEALDAKNLRGVWRLLSNSVLLGSELEDFALAPT